jgi:hypothetical protein
MIGDIEWIIQLAKEMGISWRNVQDIGKKNMRQIIDQVSAFYIERELSLKLKLKTGQYTRKTFGI